MHTHTHTYHMHKHRLTTLLSRKSLHWYVVLLVCSDFAAFFGMCTHTHAHTYYAAFFVMHTHTHTHTHILKTIMF